MTSLRRPLVAAFRCLLLLGLIPPGSLQAQPPRITEFLADNGGSPDDPGALADEDGDRSDWIELYNPGPEPADLNGWYLTDDANDLSQWTLPAVTLGPGQFRVVFASGKDRSDPAGALHTNFRLSRAGGFLALVEPDGRSLASSFTYAEQLHNVSYGITEVGSLPGRRWVAAGDPATVWLTNNDDLGLTWTDPDFDDRAWLGGRTGVGFGDTEGLGLDLPAMRYLFPGLLVRVPFDGVDPAAAARLVLRMRYDDGFVAYLNGLLVAQANAPTSLSWDSTATAAHDGARAQVFEDFVLSDAARAALRPGHNVLALHALNVTAANASLLVLPELWAQGPDDIQDGGPTVGYMDPPTPGTVNGPGVLDFVRPVTFSHPHGFYDTPLDLTLATTPTDAEIRYTLDGSTPTADHGQVYTGPLTVAGTTVVRAAAFKLGHRPAPAVTRTYLFLDDVVRQSPQRQSPGPGWPQGSVNGQVIDYGMDPDIVDHPRWADQIEAALLQVPTLSIVTDLANLFDRTTGIYVNARNDGPEWERRVSAEWILPDGTEGFAVDAGLRIRGAFSRSGSNPKHSFRLLFRGRYGTGKLQYPLFGDEGADAFEKIDLRTSQNNSWAFQGSTQNTMIRDVFSRDTQRDMGQPYTRSCYLHLYLNGQYWGLYQTQERADADYAATYLGGQPEDYDAIKNDSSGSRALQATDGTMEAYRRLYDAAVAGFTTDAAYYAVQGLRADGTPDPQGERLLNPENLMDYMLCTYFTGDPDAPVSAWAHFSNNVFALYNRTDPQGFLWFRHDAEHSLGANGGLTEGRLLTDPVDRTIGRLWKDFNPAWLHVRLCEHPDYRRRFADRVARALSAGGVLCPEANIARWNTRADQIRLAIIAESARWGDAKRSAPLTQDNWEGQNAYLTQTFFPQRNPIVIDQMRSVAMFPEAALVTFNQPGGPIDPGFRLRLSQDNGLPGLIFYTLDGTDPRAVDGTVSPTAREFRDESQRVVLLAAGSDWRYLDDGSDPGPAWTEASFDDHLWAQGPAPLGYGNGDEATVVGFGPNPSAKYPATYFRTTLEVTDAAPLTSLTLRLVRDDGARVFLNGTEVARSNLPDGPIDAQSWAQGPGVPVGGTDETRFQAFDLDPAALHTGTNTVAAEVHQVSGTSSDIRFDLELQGQVASSTSPPVVLNETTTVRARVLGDGDWGALAEARFTVGLEDLALNEFMAANDTTLTDPDEAGTFPDWIELYNGSDRALDLGGLYLTDDLANPARWRIPDGPVIPAGSFLLFYADGDTEQGPTHTSFKLSAAGEALALVDTDGVTVLDQVVFGPQVADRSLGRYPDGTGAWAPQTKPTPDTANAGP